MFLYVDDVDAVYKQAIDAGATSTMEPADQFWGDRFEVGDRSVRPFVADRHPCRGRFARGDGEARRGLDGGSDQLTDLQDRRLRAGGPSSARQAEVVGGLDEGAVFERGMRTSWSVSRGPARSKSAVRPQRLEDRPPAEPGGLGVAIGGERLRLR